MTYLVEFPSVKRPGKTCSTGYDTLAEAVRVCAVHRDQGKRPTIRCDEFTAYLTFANRHAEKPVVEWAFTFRPDGPYKSAACLTAERAGVRYVSHRRGYRASDAAMYRFAVAIDQRESVA